MENGKLIVIILIFVGFLLIVNVVTVSAGYLCCNNMGCVECDYDSDWCTGFWGCDKTCDGNTAKIDCRWRKWAGTSCKKSYNSGSWYCGSDQWTSEYKCVYESSWGGWSVFQKYIHRGCDGGDCYSYDEWLGHHRCGSSSCDGWTCCGNRPCRTCYDRGCSDGSCYENSYTDYGEDCGGDYCEGWSYYCKDNDRWRKRTCHDRGCSGGNCFDNTYTQDEKDQECGDSYWTDEYRCSGNIRQRKYINRGCSGSSCYSSEEWRDVEDCGSDSCDSWSYYCKDNDRWRKRTCHDRGCSGSSCFDNTYTQDEKDQECGDSYWTDEYRCSGNIRQRKYINRGCSGSSCYSNEEWKDVQTCTYCCINGQCVGVCSPGAQRSCGTCKVEECQNNCEWGTCSITPTDDSACDTIDCSNWYAQTGTESATTTESCYNKKDITTNRCKGFGQCKESNTADCNPQANDVLQYSCGDCCYISPSSCTGTILGSCSFYPSTQQGPTADGCSGTNRWRDYHCTGNSCAETYDLTGTDSDGDGYDDPCEDFPSDPCSITTLNDNTGGQGCDTDTDNDQAYTDPTETYGEDAFPRDGCSIVTLNDNCGGQGCDTDTDNDLAYTDPTETYGCDNYPRDGCSIITLNDNCGNQGCDTDTDNDLAYTDPDETLQLPSETYSCDNFPSDPCSIMVLKDNCENQIQGTICAISSAPYCGPTNNYCPGPDTDGDNLNDNCVDPCVLLSATWSTNSALEGETVYLKVTGNDQCKSRESWDGVIGYTIMEGGMSKQGPAMRQPNTGTFGSEATTSWIAEWIRDTFDFIKWNNDPEYYFTATIGKLSIESDLLSVERVTEELCGNLRVDIGETCDNGEWGAVTGCAYLDFTDGDLSCYAPGSQKECHFNTDACTDGEGYCGDGIRNIGEECDGDDWGAVTGCKYLGFTGGELSCDYYTCLFNTYGCTYEVAECGNNNIEIGEACDGNDFDTRDWGEINDCTDFGFTSGTLSCYDPGTASECHFNTSACIDTFDECGNAIININESCDKENLANKDCTDFGFTSGELSCYDPGTPDLECHFNTEECSWKVSVCGNDIREGKEECDGFDDDKCPNQCVPPGLPNECTCPICGIYWDCSGTSWGECVTQSETGLRTRIGECTLTEQPPPECEVYEPETTKKCILEKEFPFFTNFNIFLVILILIGYYCYRKLKK